MTFLPLRCRVDSDCRHSFPDGSLGEAERVRHEQRHREWVAMRDRINAERKGRRSEAPA